MRRNRLVVLLALAALLLSGCFKIDMDIEVNADDTVSGEFVLAMSKQVAEMASQFAEGEDEVDDLFDLDTDEFAELGDSVEVEAYEDEDFRGQRVIFTQTPLQQFTDQMAATGEDGASDFSLVRDGDTYRFSARLDTSSLTDAGDADLGIGGMFDSFLSSAQSRLSVTFPGTIVETNGEVDGRTVTWDLLSMGEAERATAVAEVDAGPNTAVIIAIVAGVALLLVIVLAIIMMRGRPRKPSPSIDVGEPTSEGPGPDEA